MPAVDFYASLPHYTDHLIPIWDALDESERGAFFATGRAVQHLRHVGVTGRPARPRPSAAPIVVAGMPDAWACPTRPAVLVEHGAGQAYNVPNPGYSGGPKRDSVALYLCPNEVSAQRNRAAYPAARVEVVGSPRVDALRAARTKNLETRGAVVTLSFHWPGIAEMRRRCPEAGWALPHYEAELPGIVASLRARGLDVIGHGHPRARHRFAALWRELDVEHVEDFADVIARTGVYVADNSSTLFEAAACDIPVVVLNAPWYRRDVDLWPRFWAHADVGIQCDDPGSLTTAISTALTDPPAARERRAQAIQAVYPLLDGRAAQRSAEAIRHLASETVFASARG